MREYFDLELKALNDKLIEMGALVEGAIKNTITIITNGEYDKLETNCSIIAMALLLFSSC